MSCPEIFACGAAQTSGRERSEGLPFAWLCSIDTPNSYATDGYLADGESQPAGIGAPSESREAHWGPGIRGELTFGPAVPDPASHRSDLPPRRSTLESP